MKKLISLLLALVMMLGVAFTLASCGDDDEPPKPPVVDTPTGGKEYAWAKADNKQINMKINLVESAYVNLCKRYMAGADDNATAPVDDLIMQRNAAAEDVTMVKANYSYWESTDKNCQWGKSQQAILNDKNSWSEASPDAYVTSLFDCMLASFQNALANLVGTHRGNGRNYFTFLEEDYNAAKNDEGYNYDLMTSFSPAPDRIMYMLASDYTIDVFRTLHAIPVSINLLESFDANTVIADKNVPDFDYDDDGVFTMDEFVQFVREGKWTYDAMSAMCAAIYKPAAGNSEESFGDSVFGFYIDCFGGASANSIVFSTPFEHFTKTVENGKPVYTQKDVTMFDKLAEAYQKLLATKGAMRVYNEDVEEFTDITVLEGTSLAQEAIAEKFGKNQILFSENAAIGVIESSYFQNMEGGFGIVPMPLVEAGDENTDYTTALGNAARVVVLSAVTDDFEECTAYLDYQSTNSSQILKAYFKSQQYDATDGEDYNIEMLTYLRSILVSQESHYMYLYSQRYAMNMTQNEKRLYFTGDPGNYLPVGNGETITKIAAAFMYYDDTVNQINQFYTTQYVNTMNAMYKLIVSKYLEVADII